jgi:hypothetical protein
MTEILFSGCSYTEGAGLDLEKHDPNNAFNVFAHEYFHNDYNVTNVAKGGNSNLSIYLSTSLALVEKFYDYAFVCWSAYPRYNFRIGFETYEFGKKICFTPGIVLSDHVIHEGHNLSYSKKWLNKFKDTYMLAHHEHFEVVAIMEYMTLLLDQAQSKGTQLYFINNICQWDNEFFNRLTDFLPDELTEKTKKLLDVDTRDDTEIFKLYNLMHDDFEAHGGIREHKWINLYTPFKNMKIDLGNDNWHPGPLSHKQFGTHLAQRFSEVN